MPEVVKLHELVSFERLQNWRDALHFLSQWHGAGLLLLQSSKWMSKAFYMLKRSFLRLPNCRGVVGFCLGLEETERFLQ